MGMGTEVVVVVTTMVDDDDEEEEEEGIVRDCRATFSIEIYVMSMGIQFESKRIRKKSTRAYNNCIGI